jgi:hypothetical protein
MDPLSAILGVVSAVVSRVWPDKTEQEKEAFTLELTKEININKTITDQLEVDIAEAASPKTFVAGWRPWIGWGLGTIVIFYAFLTLIVNFSMALGFHVLAFPPLDPMVRDITMGLLGLNMGSRTFEKFKGVNNNH